MRFIRSRYFPKQLFFRFVGLQIFVLLPTLLLAALIARTYLAGHFSDVSTVDDTVKLFDQTMFVLAGFTAIAIFSVSLWTGYYLVLPLGRILVKARSIQRRDWNQQLRDEETIAPNEPSEWSDLESMLHKIGREMQSRDRSLSRERDQVETVMSTLTEAVAAVDKTGGMLFYNSQFAVLFGPAQREARLSDCIRSPDVLEAFRETLRDGKPQQISSQLRPKGETSPRFFALSIAPLRNEDSELYGAIGVFHDLTELRRMDQVRIDFVANVSHELRTPLTAIKGYAQTLREDTPESHPSRKFLETIERNTDRLIALVHDLLNLSSLESGAEVEREEIDLSELTARVLGQLETLRATKKHEIQVSSGIQKLWADPKRVEQVLFNLLENGIKYTPPGGRIDVEWKHGGNSIQLNVSDNGPGIPLEHHSRIFERFYRVDSARTREQGGTGLGLAIVKHIMQRHGGQVSVQHARDGKGTSFTCSFPLGRES